MNTWFALILVVLAGGFTLGLLFEWRWGILWICIAFVSAALSYLFLHVNREQPSYYVWLIVNIIWNVLVLAGIVKASKGNSSVSS